MILLDFHRKMKIEVPEVPSRVELFSFLVGNIREKVTITVIYDIHVTLIGDLNVYDNNERL